MRPPRVCLQDGCWQMAHRAGRCATHANQMPRSPSSVATSAPGWKKLRARVLERDSHTCQYCGAVATHVDHVISVAHGGESTEANCVASCHPCNYRKWDRDV
jgi:5-methylcytosine-specific restriction endonuclease McrA